MWGILMDNQSNRFERDFDFGSESDQSIEDRSYIRITLPSKVSRECRSL